MVIIVKDSRNKYGILSVFIMAFGYFIVLVLVVGIYAKEAI